MKKFFKEFKEFAMKGNVIDMAVGIAIGTAFNSIVNSLVNDIIMPLIATVTSDVNFSDLKVVLKVVDTETSITLNYGQFIQYIFNFIIIALSIFLVIKAMNKLRHKEEKKEEPAPPKKSDELVALEEIRDLLKNR